MKIEKILFFIFFDILSILIFPYILNEFCTMYLKGMLSFCLKIFSFRIIPIIKITFFILNLYHIALDVFPANRI